LLKINIQIPILQERGKKATPIVATTADDDSDHLYEAGMSGYLCKPFEREDVFRILKQVLPEYMYI